ncbi:MAG: sulfite exporter TauE/SafE family protein [Bdellovibrionales bacterium]|nr:sulfite exporter TauE/SafE family protein [Bdellovibrionales bacterium]
MAVSSGLLVALGAGAGFVSGLLGIGGGVIYVPALMYLAGIPIHLAIGVSLALIVPSAAAGAFKHFLAGNIDFPMVFIIAPASILGAFLGAYCSSNLPAPVLKKAFGVFLILIGTNTVLGISEKFKLSSAGAGDDGRSAMVTLQPSEIIEIDEDMDLMGSSNDEERSLSPISSKMLPAGSKSPQRSQEQFEDIELD